LWTSVLSTAVLSQTTSDPSQNFHVQGTIKLNPWIPAGKRIEEVMKNYDTSAIQVTFESGSWTKTVTANDDGFYEVDLPFGNYLMKVRNWDKPPPCRLCRQSRARQYERELFRVTSPVKLVFDVTLPGGFQAEQFLLPAEDGTPFKLQVRFGDYRGWGTQWFDGGPNRGDPVFAEYNLCSLQASHVVYHKKQKTLEAQGDVIFDDGSGKKEHYRSILLKIEEDGKLTPMKSE